MRERGEEGRERRREDRDRERRERERDGEGKGGGQIVIELDGRLREREIWGAEIEGGGR